MIDTVLPLPASLAIAAVTLAYTRPNSKLRLLAGITIAVFNWVAAQSTIARWFPGGIGPEYILGWILACNNWLNLAQLQYQPPSRKGVQSHPSLRWAIYQIFDTRWSVAASQIPLFDKNNPQWVPSRPFFLLWKIWTVIWCGAVLYAMAQYDPLEFKHIVSMPVEFLNRLSSITFQEVWLRLYYGLLPTVSAYCSLCLMHAVCGFIAVSTFRDDPAGWKPLHGSPLEALGMRGFFHKFWHQVMRKGFTTHAVFLTSNILRLPRRSPVSRYLIVVLTFLISGFYHAALTPQYPTQCSMKQVNYQMKMVAAILIEDTVILLWKRLAPPALQLESSEAPTANGASTHAKSTATQLPPDDRSLHESHLRHRNPTKTSTMNHTTKQEPASSHSQNSTNPPLDSHHELDNQNSKASFTWLSVILRGLIYTWTLAFLIWANSTLVWSTNRCVLDASWDDELKELFGVVPSV